jgi:hypothetical protein
MNKPQIPRTSFRTCSRLFFIGQDMTETRNGEKKKTYPLMEKAWGEKRRMPWRLRRARKTGWKYDHARTEPTKNCRGRRRLGRLAVESSRLSPCFEGVRSTMYFIFISSLFFCISGFERPSTASCNVYPPLLHIMSMSMSYSAWLFHLH